MIAIAMRMTTSAAAIAVFALVGSVAVAEGPSAALTVVAAPVERSPVTVSVTGTGSVTAWREIPISSEAGGLTVTEMAVDEGDMVLKGQILARLSQDLTTAGIVKQRAVVSELEAGLATAKSDAVRARSVSVGVISVQTIEQRETLVKTTEARLEAALAQLHDVETRHRQTIIVAPAPGRIASRSVAAGQVIQTGTEIFRLIQDDRLELETRVIESDLLFAARGQSAAIVGPAGKAEHGTVRIVSPVVDPKTRLGTVRIALSPDTQLRPGMFARAAIEVEDKLALTVPFKALVWRDAKAHVFKVSPENLVSLTEVTIAEGATGKVEVLRGLKTGDRIVIQGAGLLNDGDMVNARTASINGGTLR